MGCDGIFSFQLKKEVLLICVASFSNWVIGTVFIWCAKNIEVLVVLILILKLSYSLDPYFDCIFNYFFLFQAFLGRAGVWKYF